MEATTNTNATALAALRVGIGAALVLAPGLAARAWVGEGADGRGSKVFARTLGARDIALGGATLAAIRNGDEVGTLLRLGLMTDVADAAATLVAARNLTPARRFLMPLVAAGVGALGYAVAKRDLTR